MPCYQEQERRKRQAYIEQHRRDVDLYKGITDPVEVLKIMHAKRAYDPLIRYLPYPLNREQVYSSLSGEDAERMKVYALELLIAGDEETSVDILLSLLCYNNVRLTDCIPELIGHELYYPGILYKDASAEVRDQLLEQVEQDSENRNHLLLALAWIGDGRIVQQFQQWRQHPPQWAKELFVSPDQYSLEAGFGSLQKPECGGICFLTPDLQLNGQRNRWMLNLLQKKRRGFWERPRRNARGAAAG